MIMPGMETVLGGVAGVPPSFSFLTIRPTRDRFAQQRLSLRKELQSIFSV
jgi:hypothetical protein